LTFFGANFGNWKKSKIASYLCHKFGCSVFRNIFGHL